MTGIRMSGSIRTVRTYVRNNRVLLILYVILLGSLCIGPSFSSVRPLSYWLTYLLNTSLSVRGNGGFLRIFLFSLCGTLSFLIPIFLSGIAVFGMASAPFFLFCYGVAVSAFAGLCYSVYQTKGLLMFLALYLLPCTVSAVVMLLGAREAVTFSSLLAKSFSAKQEPMHFHNSFRLYVLRFVFLLALSAGASLLSALLSLIFYRLFHL